MELCHSGMMGFGGLGRIWELGSLVKALGWFVYCCCWESSLMQWISLKEWSDLGWFNERGAFWLQTKLPLLDTSR